MLSVILISILFNAQAATPTAKTAAPDQMSQQVPFFKSVKSLFPSGSTTLENLKRQMVGTTKETEHFYKWKKIYFGRDEIKPLFATHLSMFIIENKSNLRFKVLETNAQSLEVTDETKRITKKLKLDEAHADAYDLGYAMVLKDSYLKTKPDEQSKVQTTIPQGTRLVVDKYLGEFVLVRYQTYRGYINISELLTKFDFASFVFAGNEWQQVKAREFDNIITTQHRKIPLSAVRGLITPDSRGIIASSNQKIPLWSQVEVAKDSYSNWNMSQLKEHGLIWWKPNSSPEQITYTIDDLLKKDVASVSFHPQNPLKGVLSSNGVYMTEDGYLWKKLKQFENFNGPVHYVNDKTLFVGNYRSSDGGSTFDTYIHLEKLASAIEYQYGFLPKKLQVKKIETRGPYLLKLEIETGIRKIKMESPLFAQDWKAVRS